VPEPALLPVVYYGILKAGAVVVPLNVLLKGREIAYHLADSGAKAYFCFEGTPELPMSAEGSAGFAQTPGCEHFFVITADPMAPSPVEGAWTLGRAVAGQARPSTRSGPARPTPRSSSTPAARPVRPKGAELTHSNLVLNALTSNRLFGALATEHERHLITLPLFHSFGSTVQMNAGFAVASTLVLLPRFDAQQAIALLQREQITFFAGVPTMYWGLLGALNRERRRGGDRA
jgi:long-chain acyl-CoA synthetase